MTEVLLTVVHPDPVTGVDVPAADAIVQAALYRAEEDGRLVRTTRSALVKLDADGRATLRLSATGLGQVWHLQVWGARGVPARWVQVPAAGPVVWSDLVDVDPATLLPTSVPDPEWWAIARRGLQMGTVTTGIPGSPAAAAFVGEAPNQRLDLTIPRGDKGDKGDEGDRGDTGLQGVPGQPTAFELRGTGQPNGVVAAPPGTIYTDADGTAGAWRWLKTSGTGTTGWVVDSGDTGWRALSSWGTTGVVVGLPLPAGVVPMAGTAGRVMVRRKATTASFYVSGVTFNAAGVFDAAYGIPPEFAPASNFSRVRIAVVFSDGSVSGVARTSLGVYRFDVARTSIDSYGVELTVNVSSPYPATLPGVPVAA